MSSSVQEPPAANGGLNEYKEALLKKRKKDDYESKRRFNARAQQKMAQARQKKQDIRLAQGAGTILPEVFVSNRMKQQRNFVHYKRQKMKIGQSEKLQKEFKGDKMLFKQANESETDVVKEDALVLAIRIKGRNEGTTPQSQKILSELGLRQINNAVFLKTNSETMKKILIVQEYLTYGYPSQKVVNDLVRKRGFLRKEQLKKEPITNNVLIEELLGPTSADAVEGHIGCICLEDVIDTIVKCWKPDNDKMFERIRDVLWPFQISSKRETMELANLKHDATGRDVRKKNTKVKKGGYQGFMADDINTYVQPLI